MPDKPTMDDIGFAFDRDVVVYYGDPAWAVTNQHVSDTPDYAFSFKEKRSSYTITLKTDKNFSIDKASGKGFKEEHVKDIPLAYFFPERMLSPDIVRNKSELDIAFDENFLLIYSQNIEPNKTYKLTFKK